MPLLFAMSRGQWTLIILPELGKVFEMWLKRLWNFFVYEFEKFQMRWHLHNVRMLAVFDCFLGWDKLQKVTCKVKDFTLVRYHFINESSGPKLLSLFDFRCVDCLVREDMLEFTGVATVGDSFCCGLYRSVASFEWFCSLVPCSSCSRNGGVSARDVLGNCSAKITFRIRK